MDWKIILDGHGRKRGQIFTGNRDQQQILGPQGDLLGFHLRSADKTFDAQGRYVGPGDQRMSLLGDCPQE